MSTSDNDKNDVVVDVVIEALPHYSCQNNKVLVFGRACLAGYIQIHNGLDRFHLSCPLIQTSITKPLFATRASYKTLRTALSSAFARIPLYHFREYYSYKPPPHCTHKLSPLLTPRKQLKSEYRTSTLNQQAALLLTCSR